MLIGPNAPRRPCELASQLGGVIWGAEMVVRLEKVKSDATRAHEALLALSGVLPTPTLFSFMLTYGPTNGQ